MKNSAKHFILSLFVALLALPDLALAHSSAEPQHGGIVEITGDMAFEILIKDNRVELYMVDDGKPADTSQMTAKLKVRTAENTTEIELKADGGNRFAAEGVTVTAPARITALVTLPNGFTKTGANFDIE
jgi:hypothetical protein